MQASYSYDTRRVQVMTQIEHYDRDFQMDTAFYNRTGFTAGWSYSEVNFYPKQGTDFWLQRVHPFLYAKVGHDRIQDGDEDFFNTGIQFNFTRQGFMEIAHSWGHEPWQGQRYEVGRDLHVFARAQAFRWLNVYGGANAGPAIYYDEEDPFQGRSFDTFSGIELQPNQHLSENIEVNTVRFKRASTGEFVYAVNIDQLQDDVSVQQALPGAVPGAVRQLRTAGVDRFAGVVRVRARHGVPCRVRIALREARRWSGRVRARGPW